MRTLQSEMREFAGLSSACAKVHASHLDSWWRVGGGKGQRENVGSGTDPEYVGSRVGSSRVKAVPGAGRCPRWGAGGQPQMPENLDAHRGHIDGGNKRHGAATVRTCCHVDLEHPLEQLGPTQAGPR